jgi:hypothetical protein
MFEKCSCSHCSGNIEFDSEHDGQMVACPHCGLETKLFVPLDKSHPSPPRTVPKNVSVEIKRGVSPLGIASLVLGIGACVFCWIPFLGLLTIPFAAIGLLLAVIGKKSGLSFPVSGAVVCIVAILIALFVTGGISTLIAKHENQSNSTNQKTLTTTTMPQTESSGSEKSWSKSRVVQQGDLQIQVEQMYINPDFVPNGIGMGVDPTGDNFHIKVNISNLSRTQKIDFSTWRDNATLSDNYGNSYKAIVFSSTPTYLHNNATIYPGQEISDILIFQSPVANWEWLHLELPASNFGGSGMIRFEIGSK